MDTLSGQLEFAESIHTQVKIVCSAMKTKTNCSQESKELKKKE